MLPEHERFLFLYDIPFSDHLKLSLSKFLKKKKTCKKVFLAGVKEFIQLANMSLKDRETYYGNSFLGLHYINDFFNLWNKTYLEDPIRINSVFAPPSWDAVFQQGVYVLIYKGQEPAQALDELLKGPTIVDCGMFVQLALWFGIRHMLGNQKFNTCFGQQPFFITQFNYDKIMDADKPYSGTPLYSFLSTREHAVTPSIKVKHFRNSEHYCYKHPGENAGGQNCIGEVEAERYYVFGPGNTKSLSESEILEDLRLAFNAPPTEIDEACLALYAQNPKQFYLRSNKTYEEVSEFVKKLRQVTLTATEFKKVQHLGDELVFDLDKFLRWYLKLENSKSVAFDGRIQIGEESGYGYLEDGVYRCPPFIDYASAQYLEDGRQSKSSSEENATVNEQVLKISDPTHSHRIKARFFPFWSSKQKPDKVKSKNTCVLL